jgi:poly-gamma-glutamate capsule biosynthesis protein CapA/YwtB (metallophosphatase superfamily)
LVGDVVVANAEAPISLHNVPLRPEKLYSYRTDPAAAASLAGVGVSVLGLANNHAMDSGAIGLNDTIRHAREAGLATFGAGPNLRDAERPLLVRSGVGTVGVVAMGKDYGSDTTATADQAGTIAFSSAAISRGYALAKSAGADWVVAYVHWGENYQGIQQDQLAVAERFAAAGYDLVVGHGPHVVQGIGQIGSMPVVYSLGNFVFGAGGRFAEYGQDGYGLVLNTVFTETGLSELRLNCIVTDNEEVAFQPVPCSTEDSSALLSSLHGGLVVEGNSARLVVQPGRGVVGTPDPSRS